MLSSLNPLVDSTLLVESTFLFSFEEFSFGVFFPEPGVLGPSCRTGGRGVFGRSSFEESPFSADKSIGVTCPGTSKVGDDKGEISPEIFGEGTEGSDKDRMANEGDDAEFVLLLAETRVLSEEEIEPVILVDGVLLTGECFGEISADKLFKEAADGSFRGSEYCLVIKVAEEIRGDNGGEVGEGSGDVFGDVFGEESFSDGTVSIFGISLMSESVLIFSNFSNFDWNAFLLLSVSFASFFG